MSANRSQLFINQYNALFCVFMLETYPSWVSIKTFCCGEAYSCINDCLCIVEYKIHITNFNDWNMRICLATRKRLDRHPWRVCCDGQKKSVARANNHTKKRKNAPFKNIWLFVMLVFLIKTTAVHNFHHVYYDISLFKYIYIPTSFQGWFSLWATIFVCLSSANCGRLLVN